MNANNITTKLVSNARRFPNPFIGVTHTVMKIATYFLIFTAALATAIVGNKSMTAPITATALAFIAWAVSPYIYLAVAASWVSAKASITAVFALSLLVGAFGVWLLVDVMFIHPDAQGGLVFIFVPLWQWVLLVLTALPLYFLNRVKNT